MNPIKAIEELNRALVMSSSLSLEIDEKEGELTTELADRLQAINLQKEDAIEAIIQLHEWAEMREEAFLALATSLSRKAARMSSLQKFIKKLLEDFMRGRSLQKLQGSLRWATLVEGKAKVLVAEDFNDPTYLTTQIVTKTMPNKDLLRAALEAGTQIDGAQLEQNYSVRLYPNKPKKEIE